MSTSVLSILIDAKDSASGALNRVSSSLNKVGANAKLGHTAMSTLGTRMGQAARGAALLAGTTGLLGLGAALTGSISKARDFAASMELLRTQTGATQAEVDSMSTAVLNLSGKVATSPEVLATGLYHIESAGLRGAQALEILKVAAEGARVGGADLESVTNALIAANQSGIKGVQDMASAMGTLNAIVGSGNMRMQDLADAIGTGVLSTAKNFGVTIQSVGAALADMTDQGIPAVDAATRLNSAMRLMAAPVPKAVKLLASIGLTSTTLANDMRGPGGVLAAIEDLRSHLDKSGLSLSQQAALLANAFGGKQSGGILTLVGNVDLLKKKVDAVNLGAKDFAGAWDATTHTAAFKFENFGAIVDATMTKIGTKLLPVVADALGTLGDWFSNHADDIANFFTAGAQAAQSIAGVIGKIIGAFNMLPDWLKQVLVGAGAEHFTARFLLGFDPLAIGLKMAAGFLAGKVGSVFGNLFGGAGAGALAGAAGDLTVAATALEGAAASLGGAAAAESGAAAALETSAVAGGGGLFGGLVKNGLLMVGIQAIAVGALAVFADDIQKALGSQYDPTKNLPLDQLSWPWGPKNTPVIDLGPLKNILGAQPGMNEPAAPTKPTSSVVYPSARINPATVSDYALRHPSLQKTPPPITAAEFERILRTTPFIGTAQYKSIFEQFSTFKGGGRGLDPTGSTFLTLVERLKDPKAPAVMFEIRGHLKELENLEAYYVAHGDVANARKVQGVIDKVDNLIGLTRDTTKATPVSIAATKAAEKAIVRTAAITDQGSRRVANILGTVQAATDRVHIAVGAGAARTAQHLSHLEGLDQGILVKKTTVSVHASIPVTVVNNLSINEWQRKVVSAARAAANYGGFI